ncbi:citrate lyase holo-[acyl-carrier protein] synthase ['Planchonia careya' phytoplasma]|nr:citrate lyase holo-[acyl-carrier protein] synthase ['Planchonia careya' phytoplasma]MDO8030288.1 citrate lyase holo-[acyl-carrier protein] synthase ['Planchonia careya' phytoplasma]
MLKLIEIKKNFLILEKTHICFRLLVDLDIINLKHENISRNLFYPSKSRLCFMCSKAAKKRMCFTQITFNRIGRQKKPEFRVI